MFVNLTYMGCYVLDASDSTFNDSRDSGKFSDSFQENWTSISNHDVFVLNGCPSLGVCTLLASFHSHTCIESPPPYMRV